MRRVSLICTVAAACCLGVSCAGRFRYSSGEIAVPSAWPMSRANLTATGNIAAESFTGKLNLIWHARVGDKPIAPLTLDHGKLVLNGSRKRVWFFDCKTGDKQGKLKVGSVVQGGLRITDSLAYAAVGYPGNKLSCISLVHGKHYWEVPIKDVSSTPIIVDDRLIMSSGPGILTAYDLKTGKTGWKFSAEGRLLAAPSYADGLLYLGSDQGLFYAISASDGKELYRVNLKNPIVNSAAIGQYVYVADVKGNLNALSLRDSVVVWQAKLRAPVWTAPTLSDSHVIVAHSGGEVIAFDALSGQEQWRYDAVDVVKASPIIVGKYVIVGTMTGTLLVLDGDNGFLVSKAQIDGAIEWSPVSDGSCIYVATQTGRILCYGELHDQPR